MPEPEDPRPRQTPTRLDRGGPRRRGRSYSGCAYWGAMPACSGPPRPCPAPRSLRPPRPSTPPPPASSPPSTAPAPAAATPTCPSPTPTASRSPSRISPAKRCWSISGPAGASPAAPKCRRSTSSRRSRTTPISWSCRSTPAKRSPTRARPFFAAGNWKNLPLYIDPNFAVLDRLKTTARLARPPHHAAARQEGLRDRRAAGPRRLGLAGRHAGHRRAEVDMSGVVLCVGALASTRSSASTRCPLARANSFRLKRIEVAQGMATAQAASIVKLGGRARLWASCGDDAKGDRLVRELADAGVDLGRAPRARRALRLLLDPHGCAWRTHDRAVLRSGDPLHARRPAANGRCRGGQCRRPLARCRRDGAARRPRARHSRRARRRERPPTTCSAAWCRSPRTSSRPRTGARAATGIDAVQAARAPSPIAHGCFVAVTAGARGVYLGRRRTARHFRSRPSTRSPPATFSTAPSRFGLAEGWDEPRSHPLRRRCRRDQMHAIRRPPGRADARRSRGPARAASA